MKNHIKSIILIGLITLFISCEKDQSKSIAGCEINGYWIGNWESGSQFKGTFISGVEQALTNFEGEVGIHVQSPNIAGYFTDYEGTVKDKNIKVVMDVSSIDIIVEGNVSDIQTVGGEFKVPDLEMQGTFTGEMLPSSSPSVIKIYSFTPTVPGERIHDILCVDNKLWIFMYPYEFIGEEAMLETIITDLEGNVLTTSYFPYDGYSYSYDGLHVWSISNGSNLIKFDVNGNRLDTIEMSFSSFKVAGDGQNLYFPIDNYNVLKTDLTANIIDTIAFDYAPTDQPIVYNDSFLSYGLKTIFQSDKEGNIEYAYPVKEFEYISKLVTNHDKIWALVEDYNPGSGDNWDFYVYKISF